MVEPVRHRRTKGAETDMFEPKATASHLDSTRSRRSKHRPRPVRDVLRDRNDLTGCADFIPNGVTHQKPCHWGYERNRTSLRVRFVLSHDTIFLHASVVAPESHRAAKGN